MSRACCHHYPGRISGCVSRSLHRRRRPSPLLWRVGSHIDGFEACSMFTHVAARTVRWPPTGPSLEVLQVIRRLLTRPECFRLEREFAGPDSHRGEQCTLPRHTQHLHRAVVAVAEARGNLPERLCRRPRGPRRHHLLGQLLQFPAPSSGAGKPGADDSMAGRDHRRARGYGCGYDAALGQRWRVAHISTAAATADSMRCMMISGGRSGHISN